MRTNTALGMSLGNLLADAYGGSNKQKGQFDAEKHVADVAYKNASAEKAIAEADLKRQEFEFGTDDSLAKSLLASVGGNHADGLKDFNDSMAGNYKPLVGAPTEQQKMAGNSAIPQPGYVSKFPQLQEKFAGLKQMLALGDKNLEHLSGSIKGDQRNAATANITPENAARIGMVTSAIDGDDPTKLLEADLAHKIAGGDKNMDLANALLLSQGKTRFDSTGSVGTMDLLTGLQNLNEIGTTEVGKNKAQAAQSYAGANENNAQADLATTRKTHIKEGKGDGSFKVDSSYQQALSSPALDKKGNPVIDPFSGRQVMNRNIDEETNFVKWASDNKYPSTDAAIGAYISQGRPRATSAVAKPAATPKNTSPRKSPDQIKADFKAGKLTRKQAESALKAQGYK